MGTCRKALKRISDLITPSYMHCWHRTLVPNKNSIQNASIHEKPALLISSPTHKHFSYFKQLCMGMGYLPICKRPVYITPHNHKHNIPFSVPFCGKERNFPSQNQLMMLLMCIFVCSHLLVEVFQSNLHARRFPCKSLHSWAS